VQGFEVQATVTFYLRNVVCLGNGPVTFPLVGGDLGLPAYVVDKDILQRPCGEVLYPHGVHTPDLSVLGKLYGSYGLLFLGVVATSYLTLFEPAEHKLVNMYLPVHRMVAAGFHRFPYLEHEKTRGLFGYTVAHSHIACRKALGTGRHLETDEESFANAELYLMEQRIGSR